MELQPSRALLVEMNPISLLDGPSSKHTHTRTAAPRRAAGSLARRPHVPKPRLRYTSVSLLVASSSLIVMRFRHQT